MSRQYHPLVQCDTTVAAALSAAHMARTAQVQSQRTQHTHNREADRETDAGPTVSSILVTTAF